MLPEIFTGILLLAAIGYLIRWKAFKKKVLILSDTSHFIPKPSGGRRLVVPDIHGCSQTLQKLLEDKVCITLSDQLFFLGDYISRGPGSSQVLDYIMDLRQAGFQVYTLKGNHEQMLLNVVKKSATTNDLLTYVTRRNCLDLLNEQLQLKEKYAHFLEKLDYFYELDQYLLVHAGFNFQATNPFKDEKAMLWIRHYTPDASFLKGKKIVQGHNPTPLKEVMARIQDKSPRIKLDNGCVFFSSLNKSEKGQLGHLLCFNLDNQQVWMQHNIDRQGK